MALLGISGTLAPVSSSTRPLGDPPRPEVVSLEVTAAETGLLVGETVQLEVFASYADGSQVEITGDPFLSYQEAPPGVLTVDSTGLMSAVAGGQVGIIVGYLGNELPNEPDRVTLDLIVRLLGDRDSDGIPDEFEVEHNLDPDLAEDASADFDSDGLLNLQEFEQGTLPRDRDTDRDGRLDGVEIFEGTDPLTPDPPSKPALGSLLDEDCIVSVLNRTGLVRPGGDWVIANVPTSLGRQRVRTTCLTDGVTRSGQSDYFTVPPNGVVRVGEIVFDTPTPVPARLELTSPVAVLTSDQPETQLVATAFLADGQTADVTGSEGTRYVVSNPAVATVSPLGKVSGQRSGVVLVTAAHEGASGFLRLEVVLGADTDGDGIADDLELALGLDPNDPLDALEDPDRDDLATAEELSLGTDPFDPDFDGDGLLDGEEVLELGTDPLLYDTDGDQVSDGLEALAGSDPLNAFSVDLAPILESFTVEPASFTLTFNTVVGEASRRLRVTGSLVDGTALDVTGGPYGTAYRSTDLGVANFGAEAGRVFAGQEGTAVVTASIGAFSASSEVTVRSFSPTALSFIRIPGFANDVAVQGDYAYVAAGARGLHVVNVASLTAPSIVGSVDTPGNANGVDVDGDYAYVADGGEDLRIVDVSNPSSPLIVGAAEAPGRATDIVVANGLVYMTAGIWGLHIFDVSDPTAPILLSSVNTGDAHGVDVADELVLVADGSSGVQVIDASDPAVPLLVGTTHTRAGSSSAAAGVAVRDGLAWVADGSDVRLGGLRALDVSQRETPVVIGSTTNDFGLTNVVLERDFALASDYFFANAVTIFNIAGPVPIFSAVLDFSGAPSFRWDVGTSIAVQNGAVFLTGASGPQAFDNEGELGDTGLHIGRYLDPESISNEPPQVRLVDPVEGAQVLERRRVTVRAEAFDDVRVAEVEFLVDGQAVRLDFKPPFEHTFSAPAGSATLTLGAIARDLAGNQGIAEDITLEVIPDVEPTARFLSPADGALVTEGTILQVVVLATDDSQVASVELSIDGAVQQISTDAPYVFDVSVPLGQSVFELSAMAIDDSGQSATTDPLTLAILPDQPPSVAIVEPADGAEAVAGGVLRVVASAVDDFGVERVYLRADGQVVGEDFEAPYEFEANVSSAVPEWTLIAGAVDTLGQVSESEEVRLSIAPDPLTTIFGRVVTTEGLPVGGATVQTAVSFSGTSAPGGFFEIDGVPTVQGDLVGSALAEIDGVVLAGESGPVVPIAGGVTDVGDIEISESGVGCPCVEPSNWSGEHGGGVWETFMTSDLTNSVGFFSCVDNGEETAISIEVAAVEFFIGISVSAVPAACHARSDTNGVEEMSTLEIGQGQVEACRQEQRSVAQGLGVPCLP